MINQHHNNISVSDNGKFENQVINKNEDSKWYTNPWIVGIGLLLITVVLGLLGIST